MSEIWIERLPFIYLTDRDRDVEEENFTLMKGDVVVGPRTTARARGLAAAHVQLTKAFLALPLVRRQRILEVVVPALATKPCAGCSRALERAAAA